MPTSKTWPGGASTPAPAAYSIPATGELNWAALSDFLNALGDGAQATSFQKFAVRKATTSPVTVSASTDCAVITDLAVAGAVTVNLPAGANKQVFFIVDGKGDAQTNNITINRNGSDTIAGATTLVISTNRQGVVLIYNSSDTDWKILANTGGQFTAGAANTVLNNLTAGNPTFESGPRVSAGYRTLDTMAENFTVASGETLFHPLCTIDTGFTLTVTGTLYSPYYVAGPGTLAGAGLVFS